MNRIKLHSAFVAALCAVVSIGSGCREQSTVSEPSATSSNAAKPSPEESFESIVETFRRGVAEIPIGFVLRDSSGHSRMTGENKVSHELIPPANEGDPYKGIITVESKSQYSIQRSTSEDDDEAESDEQSSNQNADTFAALDEESGAEILDPDLISTAGAGGQVRPTVPESPEKTQPTVARKKDEQKRQYELVYEGGKWVLTTKLDPETEQSIQNAFDRALKTQI
jgi:hypothetical protein